jgi:hypothetical protein
MLLTTCSSALKRDTNRPRHSAVLGNYSAYMYIEDDTLVPWPAIVSWAFDTEVLAPLGFIRGFYRTEVDPTTGDVVMLDNKGASLPTRSCDDLRFISEECPGWYRSAHTFVTSAAAPVNLTEWERVLQVPPSLHVCNATGADWHQHANDLFGALQLHRVTLAVYGNVDLES